MALEKAKLFWELGNQPRKIIPIPYDDRMDYYMFVKEHHDAGFRQVIVTSGVMIQLIQKIVIRGFRISRIEMVDDDELEQQVRVLLDRIYKKPACLSELISLLSFLSGKSSIAIQRISIRGRTEAGIAIKGFIQSNGLLGMNREVSERAFADIGAEVGRCVFGRSNF